MLGKTKVKYIQSLSHKKFRDEYGAFIIEGPKIVEEFLVNNPELFLEIYALTEWLQSAEGLLHKVPSSFIHETDATGLARISALTTANQVLAVIKKTTPSQLIASGNALNLLLDGIQDPGNMGTIIRTADWFGIRKIFCSLNSADMYNSKVVQSTMGSLLRVEVMYTDLSDVLEHYSQLPAFAATLEGENLYSYSGARKGLLLIGNESKGVSAELITDRVKKITIPRVGKAESLNAAVATGIILSRFCS